jgi:hypothetical protein
MQEQLIPIIVIALIVVIGVAVWLYSQQRKTKELRGSFGPEYERAVHETGDRGKAEAELEGRKERVEQLKIRALEPREREQFAERWKSAQAQFVDDPNGAIKDADRLVAEVMQVRGYPVGEFEQRAADVSVEHPTVVEHYRSAHAIAQQNEQGSAQTEDLRQAMVHYRALFEDLLETSEAATEVRR